MTQETVTIENKTGIHARPASVFVQTATKFKSKIHLEAKGKKVDAKSILMLMSLGLVKGTECGGRGRGSRRQGTGRSHQDEVRRGVILTRGAPGVLQQSVLPRGVFS